MKRNGAEAMHVDMTSKPFIAPVLATELVTAAWQLYRRQGWADRANRSVVTEPIYAVKNVPEQNVHTGDMIVPSLYQTLVHNAVALDEPTSDIPLDNAIHLEINDAIRAQAAADREVVINDNVLRTLQEDHNEFRGNMAKLLHQELIRLQDFKTLAYITTMAESVRAKAEIETVIDRATNSVLAPVDHTVDVAVTILSTRYNQTWNTYNHAAITDDGCMCSFFYKTRQESMSRMRITGKVKAHNHVWHRPDLAETRLNYVKIVNTIKDIK